MTYTILFTLTSNMLSIELLSTNPFADDAMVSASRAPTTTSEPSSSPIPFPKMSQIAPIPMDKILSKCNKTVHFNNPFRANDSNNGQNECSNIHEGNIVANGKQLEAEHQTISTAPHELSMDEHFGASCQATFAQKSMGNQLSRPNLNNKPLSRSPVNLLLYGERPAAIRNLNNLQSHRSDSAKPFELAAKPITKGNFTGLIYFEYLAHRIALGHRTWF